MLLVRRTDLVKFVGPRQFDQDWIQPRRGGGNPELPDSLPFGLPAKPELFAATGNAIESYIETGTIAMGTACHGPATRLADVDTPGGMLFHMLDAETLPAPAEVAAFVAALPSGPIDAEFRLGLLFLSLACGDAGVALAVARRLAAEMPELRDAYYAQVAVLAECGRWVEAVAVAEAWCEGREPDSSMRKRAMTRTGRKSTTEAIANLFVDGGDRALDAAAAMCGASSG